MRTFPRGPWLVLNITLFLATMMVLTLTGSWVWYLAAVVPGVLVATFTQPEPRKPVKVTLADARHDIGAPCDCARCR